MEQYLIFCFEFNTERAQYHCFIVCDGKVRSEIISYLFNIMVSVVKVGKNEKVIAALLFVRLHTNYSWSL